ncbi:phospholipase D family protein [Zavarzinella formosa]|uniref:phospholipase D family protein n=1 Tax=Zavarzinella formosa TaxID=360055 RepID=UPI0002E19683|nr:phospholipase D family protein [Zavarzinella formosa]
MPTVYNQAISTRFGIELNDLFSNDNWTRFDAAVAWVRRSGLRHLTPSITDFLNRGGEARFVIGIDIENTSKEGLQALLDLPGNITTFIHHNEHPSVTFHPKVYVFSNDDHARLIIGSNNLTESGLYTNTEAGLQVDAAVTDPVIVQMHAAIDSWCDTTQGFAKKLDAALLAQLEAGGYVATEETLNRRRANTRRPAATTGVTAPAPLFRSRAEPKPVAPAGTTPATTTTTTTTRPAGAPRAPRRSTAPTSGGGTVLLVRPRLARGTQMQIPIPLKNSAFLNDITEMRSDTDSVVKPISGTHPERGGGTVNTYKMELQEAKNIDDPVMRIWRTPEGVVFYRVYDADSADGTFILQRLEEGRHTNPPQTTVTKPSDPGL